MGVGRGRGLQVCRRFNITAAGLDSAAVFGFPGAFAIFNAVYWTYYMSRLPRLGDDIAQH